MKSDIKVPAMGESISEATVGTIIKPTGSKVALDDEILELETDKVNQVIFAPQDGIITITVSPEQTVKIGDVIGYVESDGDGKGDQAKVPEQPTKEPKAAEEKPETQEPVALKQEQTKSIEQQPLATQKKESARISKESFISNISNKKPSQNIPEAAASQPASRNESLQEESRLSAAGQKEGRETRKKMSKIRRVIAKRLVEVQQTTAMLTTFNEVDMTQIMAIREKYKEDFIKEHGAKLGFMSFFVKACVSALEIVPDMNSYIDGEDLIHREYYDIGIAVGTDRGLIVPVLRNCDQLTFPDIEKAIENFAKKARGGSLTADDLQGGGFTITNGGVYGSLLSTPIINPPQCGILGMHKIQKRAVVVDDQIVIKPMMYLALSYDHRIVDGKEAVSFLIHIKNYLEDPARLLLHL